MTKKEAYEEELINRSDYVSLLAQMFEQDFGKKVIFDEIHALKLGDGNSLFYVKTNDNYKFLVDFTGKKDSANALMYWIENIDFSGKLTDIYFEPDAVAIIFNRGKDYNNEYLVYFYIYGNRYPAIRFIPESMYQSYIDIISKKYRKHNLKSLKLPSGILA